MTPWTIGHNDAADRVMAHWDRDVREWQERHADLAATLRTILAMCAHTEKHHGGGPTFLARSIRELIEGPPVGSA